MNDESKLRQKVREAMEAGKLPKRRPERMWGGPGSGACCRVCGEPVKHDDVEFELDFFRADGDPATGSYHVHSRCFAAWELERKAERQNGDGAADANPPGNQTCLAINPPMIAGASNAASGTGVNRRVLPGASDVGTMAAREFDTPYKRGRA
jgi:hypothetical protein